uniref:cupin domain-containing protein n=1 Tax=uncultured Sphingomonas sp. TaxID=158754 RepID=UPI0035CBED3B
MNASSALAFLLLAAAPAAAAPEERIAPLVQQPLTGVAGKQFAAAVVIFPPGARALPHRHGTAFLYAYVLQGTVRSQIAGQPVRIYRTGEGWVEQPGVHHLLTENASQTAPARLLVTFVSDKGAPLKIPDHR